MTLRTDCAEQVLRITQYALRSVGLPEDCAQLIPENLIGDDDPRCEGYVQLDGGIDIYPCCIGTKTGTKIGWGVSATVYIPGCHTTSNGDPGYPDDYDTVVLLRPSFESRGLNGSYLHPQRAWSAVELAVVKMVESRLRDCLGNDDDVYIKEVSDG